ncbi:MAG: NAD-dependent epimerase/dehydratase family protein [Fimbriimonadaceae bacterium]|nr:NAD-dependent epimerase/dehydratase family protein [Fimbriimonadaceae bacterium]
MPRLLVTGGAGFIGSHLVDALVARGDAVVVLDDLSTGSIDNLAGVRDQIDLVHGSVQDREAVRHLVQEVDAVCHLAAISSVQVSVREPERSEAVNVEGTRVVCEEASAAGKPVLFASSSAIYGDGPPGLRSESDEPRPATPYARQKLTGEDIVRASGNGLSLRFFNVYGARQNPASDYAAVIPKFLSACREGRPLTIFGDGSQTRDFVHISDVVRAMLAALDKGVWTGEALNIATGQAVSVLELGGLIQEATGARVGENFAPVRPGDVLHSCGDPRLAESKLGFRTRVDLKEGLRQMGSG